MTFPQRLVLATRNPGKVKEIVRICGEWPVEWLTFRDVPLPSIEEAGAGYAENALIKAEATARAVGTPAVADDSGIEVVALGGAPGHLSARFAGPFATAQENLRLLIDRVGAFPPEQRKARYRCVAVCVWPDGEHVRAQGTCEGRLILEPRGEGGFGYDPIFVPDGQDRTMAELLPDEKDAISHRGKAFRALGEALTRRR